MVPVALAAAAEPQAAMAQAQAVTITEHTALLGLVPFAPLVGALFLAAVMIPARPDRQWQAGWVATIFSLGSFLVALALFAMLQTVDAVGFFGWTWFAVDQLKIDFALRMDQLSGVMTLVVTGVGTLIHLYAIGYMDHDENRPRFFCYLNLFLFSMLLLVLGDNLLVMFVGWEGVGLCSYLLIGFWHKEMPNANAGQKAFVVNRIGDAGFLLGIFLLFWNLGTVNFNELQAASGSLSHPWLIEAAALLLFIGAVGKSAQIPLFVWLPDAMAGPTPVSALIHAATMVTAGVYMITRMSFLYIHAPVTLAVISIVGAATAFVAATIALVQNDIKKVLAYSTVSQLGYMFMALGAGAFSNGIYHVVTHAFFKALLFMGAGSVIVGCHHVQDMREYGGLWKKMPITFATYLVATFAIAGLPPGSGFYSKDAVLWAVFSNEGLVSQWTLFSFPLSRVLWFVGLLTALLTAFYMTRSLVMTFAGSYRGHEHPHETPWVMTAPLIALAIPSAFFALFYGDALMQFLAPWARPDMLADHSHNHTYHLLEMVSIAVAALGAAAAAAFYLLPAGEKVRNFFFGLWPALTRFLQDKWRFDELYGLIVIRPLRAVAGVLFSVVDRSWIDGAVNGTGIFVSANGEIVRRMHTGKVGTYAIVMFCGTLCMLIFWLVV